MVKINGDIFLKTFYIPCGNLTEEYLNIQLKIKIMQMMMNGQIDMAYLGEEIGMKDFLAMIKEEYNPEISMKPSGQITYDSNSESYVMEYKIWPNRPGVDMDSYLVLDTERYAALALYLKAENPEDGDEYIVGPNSYIDYKNTLLEMQQEAIRWLEYMDISEPDLKLDNILTQFSEFIVGVIYLGEVVVVVFDTIELFGEPWGTSASQEMMEYGMNGCSNQNILLGFENTKQFEDFGDPGIDVNETDDNDWSSF